MTWASPLSHVVSSRFLLYTETQQHTCTNTQMYSSRIHYTNSHIHMKHTKHLDTFNTLSHLTHNTHIHIKDINTSPHTSTPIPLSRAVKMSIFPISRSVQQSPIIGSQLSFTNLTALPLTLYCVPTRHFMLSYTFLTVRPSVPEHLPPCSSQMVLWFLQCLSPVGLYFNLISFLSPSLLFGVFIPPFCLFFSIVVYPYHVLLLLPVLVLYSLSRSIFSTFSTLRRQIAK